VVSAGCVVYLRAIRLNRCGEVVEVFAIPRRPTFIRSAVVSTGLKSGGLVRVSGRTAATLPITDRTRVHQTALDSDRAHIDTLRRIHEVAPDQGVMKPATMATRGR